MKTPGGFKSRVAYLIRDHAYVLFTYTALLAVAQPASAQVAFEDVSNTAGFANSSSETWGAAWGDVNGDSYPDLFFSNHRTRATLYRNNRNGTFTEVSAQSTGRQPRVGRAAAPTSTRTASRGVTSIMTATQDLYQAVESSSDMLHTNASGLLTNHTADYGVNQLAHGATRQNLFFDFNGDGRLDLASIALTKAGLSAQT